MSRTTRHLAAALGATIIGIVVCTAAVAWHQGYRAYVVRTGSMEPTFHPGDAVIDRPVKAGYHVGNPITFEIAPGSLVTHRLRSVDAQGRLHTKGDANETPDAWALSTEQVRGVVSHGLPKMGYAIVFMQQKTGIAGVMTSALALFLLWGLCFPSTAVVPEKDEKARPRLRIPRQRAAAVALAAAPGTAVSVGPEPVEAAPVEIGRVRTPVATPSGPTTPRRIPSPRDPSA